MIVCQDVSVLCINDHTGSQSIGFEFPLAGIIGMEIEDMDMVDTIIFPVGGYLSLKS